MVDLPNTVDSAVKPVVADLDSVASALGTAQAQASAITADPSVPQSIRCVCVHAAHCARVHAWLDAFALHCPGGRGSGWLMRCACVRACVREFRDALVTIVQRATSGSAATNDVSVQLHDVTYDVTRYKGDYK